MAIIEKIHFLRAIIMNFSIILIDHMCTYTIYNDSNFIFTVDIMLNIVHAAYIFIDINVMWLCKYFANIFQYLILFYFNSQNNEIYVSSTGNSTSCLHENFLSSKTHTVQVKLYSMLRNEGENMLSTHYIIFSYVSCKNIEYWI